MSLLQIMCNETFYTCTIVHIYKCFFGVKPRSKNLGSELIYLLHFDKYFQIDLQKAVPKYPPTSRSIPISFNIDQPWVLSFFLFALLHRSALTSVLIVPSWLHPFQTWPHLETGGSERDSLVLTLFSHTGF